MTPEELQKLKAEIREALKHCPSWHRVIMGNNGKVYPVRHDPMPPKISHSIGFSGRQMASDGEGSSTLDFPLIHDAWSQDQP
jgi:hypothetical protein